MSHTQMCLGYPQSVILYHIGVQEMFDVVVREVAE